MDSDGYILPSKSSSQESRGWCQVLSHIMLVCVIILLTMLVPWVFSNTAGIGLFGFWIGVGQRSVTVLTKNRFPCPNDTLHDVDEWFSFAVSIHSGGCRVFMPTMRMRYGHMFSRVNSSSFLSGIIDWYYVHRRFSFLKHYNLKPALCQGILNSPSYCLRLPHCIDRCFDDRQCWHSAGNGFEDAVFFVMKWWWNLQCEWFCHYRICSCQETRNESFITETVREPEYLPIHRCRIARLSRTCCHVGMSPSCLAYVI